MFTRAFVLASLLALAAPAAIAQNSLLEGASAFGDWRSDAPGVRRKITPTDLPAPYATQGVARPTRVAARPQGVQPKAPDGFKVDLFASGLSAPRVLRAAPNGDIFVSEMGAGRVRVLRPTSDGAARVETFASGLDGVFGMAFHPPGPTPRFLYVAMPTRVVRFAYNAGDLKASGAPETIVQGLPGGGHNTRDIAFSRDGSTLYVSVGSQTNVAENMARWDAARIAAFEKTNGVGASWAPEVDRATVLAFDADGRNKRTFATGLRNCSGLGVAPQGDVWCVVNERDMLGDDLPPDYATRVKQGGYYGWPWHYIGANEDPRHKGARPDLAGKAIVPDVLFQAHSAPLSIAFHAGAQFPPQWRGAFVALHGSWNRSKRTGYKVVYLPMRDGAPTGEYVDFLAGFVVNDDSVWGRPVGVTIGADGALLVSEDAGGTVWRVRWGG